MQMDAEYKHMVAKNSDWCLISFRKCLYGVDARSICVYLHITMKHSSCEQTWQHVFPSFPLDDFGHFVLSSAQNSNNNSHNCGAKCVAIRAEELYP